MEENKKPLFVNTWQKEQVQQLLSRPQIISSHEAGWQHLILEYHRQPAAEIPEVYFQQHIVVVYLSEGIREKRMDDVSAVENSQIGDVSLIPADVKYWCVDRLDTEYIVLCVDPEYLIKSNRELIEDRTIELVPTFARPDPFIYGTALTLKQELETDYNGCCLYAESLLIGLNAHLLRKYSTVKSQAEKYIGLAPSKLRLVLDLIDDRLSEKITLSDMASYLNLSKYYFSRQFKLSTGMTPHQYVTQQRVLKAQQLLKNKRLSLTDVARSCGFNHQSHFSRVFKQYSGVTPKQYRES